MTYRRPNIDEQDNQYCRECGLEDFAADYVKCPNCGSGSIREMYPDPAPSTYSGEFPYCP